MTTKDHITIILWNIYFIGWLYLTAYLISLWFSQSFLYIFSWWTHPTAFVYCLLSYSFVKIFYRKSGEYLEKLEARK